MKLCGQDIVKGDILRLTLASPSGWIPSRNPVCKVESTNLKKGVVIVKYRNIKGINIQIGGILDCKIINKNNTYKININNQCFKKGDFININQVIYEVQGLYTDEIGAFCLVLSHAGVKKLFPLEDIFTLQIYKVDKENMFLNPLLPATMGRKLLIKDQSIVGVNFGFPKTENTLTTLEEGLKLVSRLNDFTRSNLKRKERIIHRTTLIRKVTNQFGKSEEFIKLSNFLLIPENKVIIPKVLSTKCSLNEGNYIFIGLSNSSNIKNLSYVKDLSIEELISIANNDYLISEDYIACYNWNEGWIYFLINSKNKDILDNMLRCLKTGLLALIPKPFGRTGLGVIFVDKLCYKREISHIP